MSAQVRAQGTYRRGSRDNIIIADYRPTVRLTLTPHSAVKRDISTRVRPSMRKENIFG